MLKHFDHITVAVTDPAAAIGFFALLGFELDKDVVIKADRRIKYRDVRDVMRIVNEAGFGGVGLATERIEEESG